MSEQQIDANGAAEIASPSEQVEVTAKEEQKQKEPEISYDQLLISLKQKAKQLEKHEKLQTKLEERYKEKVKQVKDYQKEKKHFETFFGQLFPGKTEAIFDKETKNLLIDGEALIKLHQEQFDGKKPLEPLPQQADLELLNLYKEENQNLKSIIAQMNDQLKQEKLNLTQTQTMLNRLKEDPAQNKVQQLEVTVKALEEVMSEKDAELRKLRLIQNEYAELKGQQLLLAMKSTPTQKQKSQEPTTADTSESKDEVQELKVALSEKTNKILELTEKLQLAQDTIQMLEERQVLPNDEQFSLQKQISEVRYQESSDMMSEDNKQMSSFDGDEQRLQGKLSDLEAQKQDLQETLEVYRQRARELVMRKDIHIQKLKLGIGKMEGYLRTQIPQDHIYRICSMTQEELANIEDQLKSIGSSVEGFLEDQKHESGVIAHIDKQISKQIGSFNDQPNPQASGAVEAISNTEYIRNVFVKYLEYLAQNNTKEIRTIENLLFTELQVTKDQAVRLNMLRQQNTFWKKMLSIPTQQVAMKNKFNAGALTQKLFGGVTSLMYSQQTATTQVLNTQPAGRGDPFNQTIGSPHGSIGGGISIDGDRMTGDELYFSVGGRSSQIQKKNKL